MSGIDAAQAASAHEDIVREVLWTGGIVKIRVPKGATKGHYPDGDTRVPFLRFAQSVRGGGVNFFVHTGDTSLVGALITAQVKVMKKTLSNGLEYLYVDLFPVNEAPTHRVTVVASQDPECSWPSEHQLFPTPHPLSGIIILSPHGAKVVPEAA